MSNQAGEGKYGPVVGVIIVAGLATGAGLWPTLLLAISVVVIGNLETDNTGAALSTLACLVILALVLLS